MAAPRSGGSRDPEPRFITGGPRGDDLAAEVCRFGGSFENPRLWLTATFRLPPKDRGDGCQLLWPGASRSSEAWASSAFPQAASRLRSPPLFRPAAWEPTGFASTMEVDLGFFLRQDGVLLDVGPH